MPHAERAGSSSVASSANVTYLNRPVHPPPIGPRYRQIWATALAQISKGHVTRNPAPGRMISKSVWVNCRVTQLGRAATTFRPTLPHELSRIPIGP
jgi:hypothetical protein